MFVTSTISSPLSKAGRAARRSVATAVGTLLVCGVLAAPVEATGITFSQFVAAGQSSASLDTLSPGATDSGGNWGWSGVLPGGYTPARYAYARDVLRAIREAATLPIRATSLLGVTRASTQPGRTIWLTNTFAPTPRTDTPFLERTLEVAIWLAIYDSPDGSATTGAAAARAVRYLAGLYRPPAGQEFPTWLGLGSEEQRE